MIDLRDGVAQRAVDVGERYVHALAPAARSAGLLDQSFTRSPGTSVAPTPTTFPPTTFPPTTFPPTTFPPTTAPPTTAPLSAAPRPVGPSRPHHEVVGEQALAMVTFPWEEALAGWEIVFLPGKPGFLGGTWTYEKRIEIYVRSHLSASEVAFTLAHELGHAVDVAHFDEGDRQRWREGRGFGSEVPWWVESGATDFSSGSGDWAESFAVWQVGGVSQTRVGGQPNAAQLALVAELAR